MESSGDPVGFIQFFARPWWSPGFTLRQPSGGEKEMEREILARLWTPGFNSAEASQFCIFFPNLEYKLEFIFNQGSINGVPTVCISLLYILEILD